MIKEFATSFGNQTLVISTEIGVDKKKLINIRINGWGAGAKGDRTGVGINLSLDKTRELICQLSKMVCQFDTTTIIKEEN